jgi:hypothetical protein
MVGTRVHGVMTDTAEGLRGDLQDEFEENGVDALCSRVANLAGGMSWSVHVVGLAGGRFCSPPC